MKSGGATRFDHLSSLLCIGMEGYGVMIGCSSARLDCEQWEVFFPFDTV